MEKIDNFKILSNQNGIVEIKYTSIFPSRVAVDYDGNETYYNGTDEKHVKFSIDNKTIFWNFIVDGTEWPYEFTNDDFIEENYELYCHLVKNKLFEMD